MENIKGKIIGIKINGEFISCEVGDTLMLGSNQQPLEVGDSVSFVANDEIYNGGKITAIDDKGHWVNGILIPFGVNIWRA